MSRLVWAGLVDVDGLREVQMPRDTAAVSLATAQGWLVLNADRIGVTVPVRSRPDATGYSGDDDDDGA